MQDFKLSELLDHEVTIQCHNFPDADTIASAFGVFTYLKWRGKNAKIIYSGAGKITKPSLLMMKKLLEIPIEHVKELPEIDALMLVDCQYGEGNVVKFPAKKIFALDHHEDGGGGFAGSIQSALGSCSTLIWRLLREENFPFKEFPQVANALYYGLYTDTCSFEEISHPLDRDMRDSLNFDQTTIDQMRFNNLTIDELTIAGNALACNRSNHEYSYAIFKAAACDQNILGFISDLALQVERVGVCIVYNSSPGGYRLSIRSCTREVMANEFAAYLANGGGHKQKAGGFISLEKVGDMGIDAYIENRTKAYFESYVLIDAASHNINVASMAQYVKNKIPVGYVPSTDIFQTGTPILIRTLEGDSDVIASPEIFLMIGNAGEVYPQERFFFDKNYDPLDEPFAPSDMVYSPTVRNKLTGISDDAVELSAHAKACVAKGTIHIHAEKLTKNTKVFTRWNPGGYMAGKIGDYLAVRSDNVNDVYIIAGDIFGKTYDACP